MLRMSTFCHRVNCSGKSTAPHSSSPTNNLTFKRVLFVSLTLIFCVQLLLFISTLSTERGQLHISIDRRFHMKRSHRHVPKNHQGNASKVLESYGIKPSNVESINCKALFDGDEDTKRKARRLELWKHQTQLEQENDLYSRTSSCRRYTRGGDFILSELTTTEMDFPLAFSVIMYRDVLQFELLLRMIYRPQNLYCIHVDQRSESVYKSVEHIAKCFPNVFLSSRRVKVHWGRISVLEADLICMQELLERSKAWKYFINLSGQEFPLKTNAELVAILTAFKGANNVVGTHSMYVSFIL